MAKIKLLHASNGTSTPPTLDEGEFAVNALADPPQLWTGVPTSRDPSGRIDLLDGTDPSTLFAPLVNPAGGQNNYLPINNPTFTGTLTGPSATLNGTGTVLTANGNTLVAANFYVSNPSYQTMLWIRPDTRALYMYNAASATAITLNGVNGTATFAGTVNTPNLWLTPNVSAPAMNATTDGTLWWNGTNLQIWDGTAWTGYLPINNPTYTGSMMGSPWILNGFTGTYNREAEPPSLVATDTAGVGIAIRRYSPTTNPPAVNDGISLRFFAHSGMTVGQNVSLGFPLSIDAFGGLTEVRFNPPGSVHYFCPVTFRGGSSLTINTTTIVQGPPYGGILRTTGAPVELQIAFNNDTSTYLSGEVRVEKVIKEGAGGGTRSPVFTINTDGSTNINALRAKFTIPVLLAADATQPLEAVPLQQLQASHDGGTF